MSCCNFLKLFVPALTGIVFAGGCGIVDPRQQTVAEGTTVQFLLTDVSQGVWIEWRYDNNTLNRSIPLGDNKPKHSEKSNKYTLLENGYKLSIKTVTHSDSGGYLCYCYSNQGYRGWSSRGTLDVKRETTSASSEQQSHLTTSSAESTNEYRSMTQSATATVESETVETEVNDTPKDNKISSTLEDTSQVTTVVVAGVIAIGGMLTVIAVVIICKKQKKDDILRASQKSGTTLIVEGTDGQDNSLPYDSVRPHSRPPSERETSAVQNEAEHNPGASCDQQASGSSTKQIDTEYATVVPKKNRISSTQQNETNKEKEEDGTPEYATVVENRPSGCSVEQTTPAGKNKNEHRLVYADLDLASRPRREAASKGCEATEYVSLDFQKTATLSQQKQ